MRSERRCMGCTQRRARVSQRTRMRAHVRVWKTRNLSVKHAHATRVLALNSPSHFLSLPPFGLPTCSLPAKWRAKRPGEHSSMRSPRGWQQRYIARGCACGLLWCVCFFFYRMPIFPRTRARRASRCENIYIYIYIYILLMEESRFVKEAHAKFTTYLRRERST